MKHFYRTFASILCLLILISFLCGCEKNDESPVDTGISVFTTFYPFYAATQMITKDVPDLNLNCLVQPQDGCIRDYQLSDWDLALLATSDLLIVGGRGLESFENLLYALGDDGPAVISVLYNMELMQQRAVNTQEDAQSHWLDPNPHIYMQTNGMSEITRCIAESLILLDPDNENTYHKNLETTNEKLQKLTSEIQDITSGLSNKKVIILNEALAYAAHEYGLTIDLCLERESGTDLTGADLEEYLKILAGTDAKVILIEKQAPQKLCSALEEAGYQIARMDILSTRRAEEGFEAYFDALRANAQAVKTAFTEANSASENINIGGNE